MSSPKTASNPYEGLALALGAILAIGVLVALMVFFPALILGPWKVLRTAGLHLISPVASGQYAVDIEWVQGWLRETGARDIKWSQAMAIESRLWQAERWMLLGLFIGLISLVAWQTFAAARGRPRTDVLTPEHLVGTHSRFSPRLRLFLKLDPLRTGDTRKGKFRVRTRISVAAAAGGWISDGKISRRQVEAFLVKQLGPKLTRESILTPAQTRLLGLLAIHQRYGRDVALQLSDLLNEAEARGGAYGQVDSLIYSYMSEAGWIRRQLIVATRRLHPGRALSRTRELIFAWLADPEYGCIATRHCYLTTTVHALLLAIGADKGRIPAHEFAWLSVNDWALKTLIDDHLVPRPSLDTLAVRAHYYVEAAVGCGIERFDSQSALRSVAEGLHRYGSIDSLTWRSGDYYDR